MTLASMIYIDEDALICDLAETYQIYDYRSLPVKLAATLSAGLRDDSRIRMKCAGVPCSQDTLLLAMIADRVEMFRYGFADQRKVQPPASVVEMLMDTQAKPNGVKSFRTSQEFEATLARLRGE